MASQCNRKETGPIAGDEVFDNDSDPGSYFTTADSLIGDKVVNAQGEDLGQIDAIMLDIANGRIAYAVLAFGGFLGIGEKRLAIPWGALIPDLENEILVLDVAKRALKNVLDWDRDLRPDTSDGQWATRIHG